MLKAQVAQQVIDGFRNAGFIYLHNHGVPQSIVSEVFGHSAKFFDLPSEEKEAIEWQSAEANRGYSRPGREKNALPDETDIESLRAQAPDLKESLEIGREDEPGHPNLWLKPNPSHDGGEMWAEKFKTVMIDFHHRLKDLHMQVMRAIAVGLGIEEKWFDGFNP